MGLLDDLKKDKMKEQSGGGFINTNCGKVKFKFSENEDNTKSVLMSIIAYNSYCPATISVSGINAETSIDSLKNILTPVEGSYLIISVNDAAFSLERTYFHMR